jgi:NAD(P)-dependent dehydrogenase (short-subunit alcohol dehydrogenase family)
MDTTRHSGKVAIVTGAGNGIGRATAARLAREGARVIGCDVNAQAIEETRVNFSREEIDCQLVVADVTSQGDVERLVELAGPRIDILANVAGIMDHFVPLDELDDAMWALVMDVNVTGVMRLTRSVLRVMEKQGAGAIVTVASEASLGAGAAGVAYTTSKHAVIGLVQSVAFFYGPKNIRSNAVLPGAVATAIGASAAPTVPWAFERAKSKLASMPPVPAQPDQIAAVISWLASEEASNVNGALVTADGGWSTA